MVLGREDLERGSHLLTVELSNGRPVDLVDLTTSLSAHSALSLG
jgi:hypothetical protein